MDVVRLRIDACRPGSAPITAAIGAACDRIEDGDGDRVLVVDLRPVTTAPATGSDDLTVHLVNQWERALRRIERLAVPTFAVARGRCGGAAAEALLVTDYRMVTSDFTYTMARRGGDVWPSTAVYRLTRQLGPAHARPLVLFGAELSAPQAYAVGLVDEVGTAEPTDLQLADLARRSGPDVAVRRRLVAEAPDIGYDDALGTHLAACDRVLRREMPTGEPA